jgi:hypothetical protein
MSTAERIAWGLLSLIVLIVWLRWRGIPEDEKSEASQGAERARTPSKSGQCGNETCLLPRWYWCP